MHSSLSRTEHRPWPMPPRMWMWRQSWLDLLFMHWPVPSEVLRPFVPRELTIQEFDGTSWVGVVPFRMEGVMLRGLPDMPGISAFLELNVRLYVERDGKPGVWFLSLDATNALAVWGARRFFHLPYRRAAMSLGRDGDEFVYRSTRLKGSAEFRARYQPAGEQYESTPGTLEHWLTERYCLYALSKNGSLLRNDVHHAPWPLFPAEAALEKNTMLDPWGIQLPDTPPLLHFAPRLDVIVWNAEPVGR